MPDPAGPDGAPRRPRRPSTNAALPRLPARPPGRPRPAPGRATTRGPRTYRPGGRTRGVGAPAGRTRGGVGFCGCWSSRRSSAGPDRRVLRGRRARRLPRSRQPPGARGRQRGGPFGDLPRAVRSRGPAGSWATSPSITAVARTGSRARPTPTSPGVEIVGDAAGRLALRRGEDRGRPAGRTRVRSDSSPSRRTSTSSTPTTSSRRRGATGTCRSTTARRSSCRWSRRDDDVRGCFFDAARYATDHPFQWNEWVATVLPLPAAVDDTLVTMWVDDDGVIRRFENAGRRVALGARHVFGRRRADRLPAPR